MAQQRRSVQNFKLPKLPKLQTSVPKYLEMDGYKDYKYKSLVLDLMKQDKRAQKALPYHLQTTSKTPRKRYELNDDTRIELLYKSRLDNIFTDQSEPNRPNAITLNGSYIQHSYNKIINTLSPEPQTEMEIKNDQIEINNAIITNILNQRRKLTVNPRVINAPKKTTYKEMNTIKEFKILVKNTQDYLRIQGLPTKMDRPYIYQFILKDVYYTFKELPCLIQDRILLAFDINPNNDEEIVTYDQFSQFKQIVISQNYKTATLSDFFVKFFNPLNQQKIQVSDIRTIMSLILENTDDQLLKYFMSNLLVSPYVLDGYVSDLREIFQTKVIDPHQLIDLLLINI